MPEYTTIKPKRSNVTGNEPSAGDLEVGELALNVPDGRLWTKDEGGNVILLGGLQDGVDLPTSDPAVVGALWNDGGTVRISNG